MIFDHFTKVHAPSLHTPPTVPLQAPPPPVTTDIFSLPFTGNEVSKRLKKATDTAPGPDTILYSEWRRFDTTGNTLAALFNKVRALGTPRTWKESVTTLIYKGGDRNSVSSWRPIALLPTISKLYGNVLVSRLTEWATGNARISRAQKGFLPFRGCSEQNHLLQTCLQDARRRKKTISCSFLDLRNAFGSVPHSTIHSSLTWLGLSPSSIDILESSFHGSSTRVRTASGTTASIPIGSGVVQGAPLSPILFNLALEPLIRAALSVDPGYSTQGHVTAVLAYADDLVVLAPTPHIHQLQLTKISELADWSGLVFNQRKCASLTLHGKETSHSIYTLQGSPIPTLQDGEEYKHLGVPTGSNTFPSGMKAIETMTKHLYKIDASLLTPWQRFDALRTFIVPQISFHLLHGHVPKGPLNEFDRLVKRLGKKWLGVPRRASNEILYLDFNQGGQGLIPLSTLADISTIAHATSLLHSLDPSVADISHRTAREVASKRAKKRVTPTQLALYLSGQLDGIYRTPTVDVNSLWTSARAATRRLSSTIPVAWYASPSGSLFASLGGSPISPRNTQRKLTEAVRAQYLSTLIAKKDQGSSYRTPCDSAPSNRWVQDGSFLRFTDWRFIHRARLNLLPVNGARRWDTTSDKRCRRCGYTTETLNHVLSSCPVNLTEIRRRHNRIHDRLRKAIPSHPNIEVKHDSTIVGTGGLRPDIVAINRSDQSAVIVEIHSPYDNGTDAINRADERKLTKYQPLIDKLEREGLSVQFHTLVVTALGRLGGGTLEALRALRIPAWYSKLMIKLLVSDAIRGSRDVYTYHITGHIQ